MKVYEIFTEIHIFEKLMILLKLFLKYNDKKKERKKKWRKMCTIRTWQDEKSLLRVGRKWFSLCWT